MSHPPPIQVELIEGPLPPGPPMGARGGGAVLTFEGVVRGTEDGQPIAGLQYQSYPPMTRRQLEGLARQVVAEFGLLDLRCQHSLGAVGADSCSFRLTVVGRHRREAIDATDAFIARMKQDVPLWKLVIPCPGADGE